MTRLASPAALTVALLGLAFLPGTAAAAWTTSAAFTGPNVDTRWQINGPTHAVSTAPEGVRITPSAPVTIYRQLDLPHPVDVVTLHATTSAPVDGMLLWHVRGSPDDQIVKLPFRLEPNDGMPSRLALSVLNYPAWDRYADAVGVQFPPGSDVTVSEVRFIGLPWYERWWNALQSLFVFDNFTRHSINFVWGPLLAFDPDTRATLYDRSPPIAWSLNRMLLPTLGIVLLALALACLRPGIDRRMLRRCAIGVIAAAWLLFDLRMGAEILRYASLDLTRYVFAAPGERTLRGMADFHESLSVFLAATEGKERLGFLSDGDLLLDSTAVYMAYPRAVVLPGEPQDGLDTWFVYHRSDANIDDAGRLTVAGTPISGTGGRVAAAIGPRGSIFTTAP